MKKPVNSSYRSPTDAIEFAIKHHGGSKVKYARALGVSRGTLYNWLKKPSSIPLRKALLIQKNTNGLIMASDLIPYLKDVNQ